MKTISHRELRNRSGEVLREVARGESYEVTNHGEIVARLIPPETGTDLRCVRPATRRSLFSEMTRRPPVEPTGQALDDLRGDR